MCGGMGVAVLSRGDATIACIVIEERIGDATEAGGALETAGGAGEFCACSVMPLVPAAAIFALASRMGASLSSDRILVRRENW